MRKVAGAGLHQNPASDFNVDSILPIRLPAPQHLSGYDTSAMNSGELNMYPKAEALAAAKKRIIELQSQMTDRILKLAAEVAKLIEVVSEREAREFLRVTCNMPSSELSTYVKFSDKLAGREDVLDKARVSLPVVRALISADDEVRTEILERMDIGARISTNDISAIRKRLKEARLTPTEVMAVRNGRLTAAAGRRNGAGAASMFQYRLHEFVHSIIEIRDAEDLRSDDIRTTAADLRDEFEHLFGSDHQPLDKLKQNSPSRQIAMAHLALTHLSEGTLAVASEVGTWEHGAHHPWLVSLQSLSGRAGTIPSASRIGKAAALPHPRPTTVELCAGAGGMAIGLERAGFDHVALVESDPHAAATLRKNRPGWTVIEDDLKTIDFRPYRLLDIDLVAGGLPCQPYSSEGFCLGKEDPRDLLPEGVRVVDEIRPRGFLFENVEGILHQKHSDHIANALRGFRKAGYRTEIHRVSASDYGVAQVRRRVLIIGLRDDIADAFRLPPAFPNRRENIGDLLLDLMAANGWTDAHEWARQRREQPVVNRDGDVVAYGVQATTIVTGRGKRRRNEQEVQVAMGFDATGVPELAPTQEEASKEGFMPSLTLRMRARIQDFPDDWEFVGGKQATARQIGNAVPSKLAQAVGLSLIAAMRGLPLDHEALVWPNTTDRLVIEPPPLVPKDLKVKLEKTPELDEA
ncbi:DNA cytosine methyltransferase [Rhizobium leguminosarum]|uniref:DNA cytosine methyltransferase n=1 Tax=Rhizobium leguminosarum TaxID=384 RepID=UPI003F9576DE